MSMESSPASTGQHKKNPRSAVSFIAIFIAMGALVFSMHNFYLMMSSKIKSQKIMVSLNKTLQDKIATLQDAHETPLQKTLADVQYLLQLANLQLTVGH